MGPQAPPGSMRRRARAGKAATPAALSCALSIRGNFADMVLPLPLLALLQLTQQPRRTVPDPGVIATGQRTTPAGVQSVFIGRVGGVRFGRSSAELWVAVPDAAYRLDWRADRVLARGAIARPGVFAVTIDPATHRALVSSVSKLPPTMATSRLPGGGPLPTNGIVAQLAAFPGDARGDSTPPAWTSPALGDYMAGAPAVAARPSPDGRRYAVIPLPADDGLAVLDADRGTLVRIVPLGVEPVAAAISADGTTAFVTVLGGARPRPGERVARQCCDPLRRAWTPAGSPSAAP